MIAGIALARRAILATHNVKHFDDAGIEIVNPCRVERMRTFARAAGTFVTIGVGEKSKAHLDAPGRTRGWTRSLSP
jgi:hypothetical protein